MRQMFFGLVLALTCSACAIVDEHVDVAYAPDPAAVRAPVARAGDVKLEVTDRRRAETPDWIADKKNSYGMRLANVLAQKPVVDIVRDALAQELMARGFRVGATGPAADVEISRLESVYQNRFLSIGAIGYADFSVQVHRPDGSIAYARNFTAEDDQEAGLAGIPAQARRSVERVLTKVVGQVVSDPAFLAALSGTPSGTPSVS